MLVATELPPTPPAYEYVIQEHNPLLSETGMICFDQIESHHFLPAYQEILAQIQERLGTLTFDSTVSFSELLANMETLEAKKEQIEHIFEIFNETMDSHKLRADAIPFNRLKVEGSAMLYHHPYVVEGLSHFKQDSIYTLLTQNEQRIVDLRYKKLLVEGAFLKGEDKETFTSYKKELTEHRQAFVQNHNDHLKSYFITVYDADLIRGVPQSLLEEGSNNYPGTSSSKEGPWAFGLDNYTTTTLAKQATSSALRKQAFLAKNEIAALKPYHNQENIASIVAIRHKMAQLLGFEDYTAMSLSTKLAPSHEAIVTTFSDLEEAAKKAYVCEQKGLQAFAFSMGYEGPLQVWDKTFYANTLKQTLYNLDFEALKSYFSFDHVISTLFSFCSELFDIEIRPSERAGWHKDVTYYTVHSPEGEMIASFFVDPFIRTGQKRPGAWMGELDSCWKAPDQTHLPLTYLVTNFKKGMDGEPCLLTLRQVTTLFHEFGHTLQHLLSKSETKTLSGLGHIEWDGVEIASQFMENWVYYKPLLKRLACHVETGATLSDATIDSVIQSHQFMNGGSALMQLVMGEYDLKLHGVSSQEENTNLILFNLLDEVGFAPHPVEQNFPCRFGHLFSGGYAAGYYSYMYAHIRSADLFAAFEEAQFAPDEVARLGKLYKQTFLEMGSHLTQDEVFALFRGRVPNTKALIRHLGLAD